MIYNMSVCTLLKTVEGREFIKRGSKFRFLVSWVNSTEWNIKIIKSEAWNVLNDMNEAWDSNMSRE